MDVTVRYFAIACLFLGVAVVPWVLDPSATPASPGPDATAVPADALDAMEEGRYWHASRILRGYLAVVPDSAPETVLLTAQAEAGWGGWTHVRELLDGQNWLDEVGGGYGWKLLSRSWWELGEYVESERAMARYLAVGPTAGDRERGLAEAQRGLALLEAGQDSAAYSAFDRAVAQLPQIADWLELFAAEAAAEQGDTAELRRRFERIDPVLVRERGWRAEVRAYREADDPAEAARLTRTAARELDDASSRAEAWRILGELRLERADTSGARTALSRAMDAASGSLAAVHAARMLSDLPGLSPEMELRIGRLYMRHGNPRRGTAGLRAYLDSGRGTAERRAAIRLELGRGLFRRGLYARAERRMLALADEASRTSTAAEALYLAGRSQYRQGRSSEGRATFERTAERFPGTESAAEAMFLIADLDHDDGRLDSAQRFYRRAIEMRPSLDRSGLAAMRLAGIAFARDDYAGAIDVYEEYRRRFPDGRRYDQATYWAALAYEALGRDDRARELLSEVRRLDPFSYYGILAAERQGATIDSVGLQPSPSHDPTDDAEVATAMARIDLLRELGLDDAVVYEVERLKRYFLRRGTALYALAEALNARGHTYTGIQLGWEIHRRAGGWNPRLLRIVYPFPHQAVIQAEAQERGLDPFLVAGLIRQESMFNADVHSPAGAIGLMQIMPATGRSLARQAGLSRFQRSILERPEINIHLGTRFLGQLFDRFGDRLPPVLAAYNAGPTRVSQWSAFPEYGDPALFSERIPYRETRHYVKVVQQNARIYAMLYDPEPAGSGTRRAASTDADADESAEAATVVDRDE